MQGEEYSNINKTQKKGREKTELVKPQSKIRYTRESEMRKKEPESCKIKSERDELTWMENSGNPKPQIQETTAGNMGKKKKKKKKQKEREELKSQFSS